MASETEMIEFLQGLGFEIVQVPMCKVPGENSLKAPQLLPLSGAYDVACKAAQRVGETSGLINKSQRKFKI